MARRADGGYLFVGRLNKNTRTRDLEEIFEPYGKITRCEIKYNSGPDNGSTVYGFVDYEDRRDAADAIKYENGRSICGSKIIVEWSKGNPRRAEDYKNNGPDRRENRIGSDECARCHKTGHWARDCPEEFKRPSRSSSRSRSPPFRRRDRSSSRSSPRRRYGSSRSRSPSDRRGSYNRRPRGSPIYPRRNYGGGGGGGYRGRSRS